MTDDDGPEAATQRGQVKLNAFVKGEVIIFVVFVAPMRSSTGQFKVQSKH